MRRRDFLAFAASAAACASAGAGAGAAGGIADVKPGDIVFRRGLDSDVITQTILKWSPRASGGRWSHAGVVTTDLSASVVHAMPAAGSYIEPWESFSSPRQSAGVAIVRLRDAELAGAIAEAAQALAGRLFDDKLLLSDGGERLYCTELVWRATKNAGFELRPAMISAWPFYPEKIIHPDSLFDALENVADVV